MKLSPASSLDYKPTNISTDSMNTTKTKIAKRLTIVYGFLEDLSNFKKNTKCLMLSDITSILDINDTMIEKSPGKFIRSVLSKNLKINESKIEKYSNELSINKSELMEILKRWTEYMSKQASNLSLSLSLNKRSSKSETAMIDFVLKNIITEEDQINNNQKILKEIESNPVHYKAMNLVYNAFLKSDDEGFKLLDCMNKNTGVGCQLINKAISTAIIRKMCKIEMNFISTQCNDISQALFIKPSKMRLSQVLIQISNDDAWRNKNNFKGIGQAYEPITFSELRHARRNDLKLTYL